MAGARWRDLSCASLLRPHMTLSQNIDGDPLIVARRVSKTFPTPAGTFAALTEVDLTVNAGDFALIVGQSGSGKSTLLGLLAGIDRVSAGEILVGQVAVHALAERELSAWRGRAVGVVFQFFQLLPTLTAAENVMLPMDFCDMWPARERRERARALLDRLGVADQAGKLPAKLSGGQQQRVAIARALANAPRVLLADEPTGNLDSTRARELLALLREMVEGDRLTVLLVTHDHELAGSYSDRIIMMKDGRVSG